MLRCLEQDGFFCFLIKKTFLINYNCICSYPPAFGYIPPLVATLTDFDWPTGCTLAWCKPLTSQIKFCMEARCPVVLTVNQSITRDEGCLDLFCQWVFCCDFCVFCEIWRSTDTRARQHTHTDTFTHPWDCLVVTNTLGWLPGPATRPLKACASASPPV